MGRAPLGAHRQQSGLRIIVLFTDGASNSVPGNWDARRACERCEPGTSRITPADPDGQTWDNPHIDGLYDTQPAPRARRSAPRCPTGTTPHHGDANCAQRPVAAADELARASSQLRHPDVVSAADQRADGGRRGAELAPRAAELQRRNRTYPAEVFNINNAARNLVEIIANDGAQRRRRLQDSHLHHRHGGARALLLGTMPETSESILKRMANDPALARPQQRAARRQVLLRADGRRRGAGVPGHSEPDSAAEQVGPRSTRAAKYRNTRDAEDNRSARRNPGTRNTRDAEDKQRRGIRGVTRPHTESGAGRKTFLPAFLFSVVCAFPRRRVGRARICAHESVARSTELSGPEQPARPRRATAVRK